MIISLQHFLLLVLTFSVILCLGRRTHVDYALAEEITQNATLVPKLSALLNSCEFTDAFSVFNYGLCFDVCSAERQCVALKVAADHVTCWLCLLAPEVRANPVDADLDATYVLMQELNDQATTCRDLYERGFTEDGIYRLDPDLEGSIPMYCELNPTRGDGTTDGGWTVFQRRVDDTVDFHRDWSDYEEGFGNITGNYWMGLRNLHRMTSSGAVRLHVYLETFDGTWAYALYDQFRLSDASDNYRLDISGYHGNAGDSLSFHNHKQFSTRDRDNDENGGSCSVLYQGAWWFASCHYSNLNGQYLRGQHDTYANGINWRTYKGYRYSMKTTIMKIRPV